MKNALLLFLILSTVLYCKEKEIEQLGPSVNSKSALKAEEKKDPKEIIEQIKKNFFDPNEDILFQLKYEDFPEVNITKLKTWGIFRAEEGFSLHEFDHHSQKEKEVIQNSGTKFSLDFERERDQQGNYIVRGETRIVGELKKVHCVEFTREYTDCKFYFDNIVYDNSEFHPYDGSTNQVIVRCKNDVVCFVSVPQEREYFPAFLWTGPAKSQILNESFRRAYQEYRQDPTAPPPSKYGFDEEKMKAWEEP